EPTFWRLEEAVDAGWPAVPHAAERKMPKGRGDGSKGGLQGQDPSQHPGYSRASLSTSWEQTMTF
ncbi:hypothetical protein P7K49_034232, partial [Saguinus oedipus]